MNDISESVMNCRNPRGYYTVNKIPESVIICRNPRGYYTVTVNGRFYGNYDTVSEAVKDLKSAEL